jgi:general secretion pathway protein D
MVMALVGAVQLADAQMRAYTTIEKVTWTQLTNAVTVRIEADGVIEPSLDWMNIGSLVKWDEDIGDWVPQASQSLSLQVANGKLGVPNFIDISTYPVSHIEFSPMPYAEQGIGCRLRLWLYKEAGLLDAFDAFDGYFEQWWEVNYVPLRMEAQLSRDQRTLLITVYSDRQINPKAKEDETAAIKARVEKADSFLVVSENEGLLDADLLNVPLAAVVRELAKLKTCPRIVLPEDINPYVTLYAKDQPPLRLLEAIGSMTGLTLWRTDGQYSYSRSNIDSISGYYGSSPCKIQLENLKLEQALNLMPDFLLRDLRPSAEHNAINIACGAPITSKVRQDIELLDQPPRQVGLSLLLVQFEKEKNEKLSFAARYQSGSDYFSSSPELGQLFAWLDAPTTILGPLGSVGNYWDLLVRGLKTNRKAELRSAPYLVTLCGQEASLFVGKTQYVKRTNPYDGSEEVGPVKLGVNLKFTPIVGPKGVVTLKIWASDSSIIDLDAQTGQPTLRSAEFTGTVRANSGETIYIGGLELERREKIEQKIPVLGDLPLLGKLFTSSSKLEVDSDFGLFITPFLLPDSQGFPAQQLGLMNKVQLVMDSEVKDGMQ